MAITHRRTDRADTSKTADCTVFVQSNHFTKAYEPTFNAPRTIGVSYVVRGR